MYSPDSTKTIFGPAVTVKMVEANDKNAPSPPKHFADCNEPGKIMYIQQPKGLYSACWGGLMSTRAKKIGAEAVIVDGRMRDINEHREMGFPVRLFRCLEYHNCSVADRMKVFARSTSILGSNTFTKASEVNVPLQFHGDLWINPGDILAGDPDGVVVVPPSLMDEVIALCQERAEVDEKTFAALRAGEEMGPTIKRFRKG